MKEVGQTSSRGGCLCGSIRYSVGGESVFTSVCHCTSCQKETGAPFVVHIAVPRSSLVVEGETKTYHDKGDSGAAVYRTFCPNCGSPIYANADIKPHLSFVFASTLDDTSALRPTAQIFCASAQPWVELNGLESFPRMPD